MSKYDDCKLQKLHVYAHLQIIVCLVSNQFDQIYDRSYGDKVGVNKGHNSIKNSAKEFETKIKKSNTHLHIIRKQSTKFLIDPTENVGGAAETRFRTDESKDAQTDGRGSFL